MDETPRRPKPATQKNSTEDKTPASPPVKARPAVARPASAAPAAAKPAPAKPAAAKVTAPKKKVDTEQDEFSSLPPRTVNTRLPPKVVKKKKSVEKTGTERQSASAEDASDPAEVLVPVILIVLGLILNLGISVLLKPEFLALGSWVGLRMALIGASTVVTIVALFVAAAALDLSYGHLHTAILKVAAIVLTQAWVGDICARIPFSLFGFSPVEWIIAFGTTFTLFKFFFDLDDMEVLASMCVVRLVHVAMISFAFAALFGAVMSGADIPIPDFEVDPSAMNIEENADQGMNGKEFEDADDPADMDL